jgi:polysaccharide biosynthesis/export protein
MANHPMKATWAAKGFWGALAILCLTMLVACKTGGGAPPPDAGVPPISNVLQEGDVILIAFPAATNLNNTVKIPYDGTFTLPFAEPIRASGKTPAELQQEILKAYGPQLQVQEVSVTVLMSSASVYVSGAVLSPGKVPLDRPMTAMEAIMERGGFDNTRAKPGKVLVIRREDGREVTMRLDLKKTLRGEDSSSFYLRPSDIVHVPFKTFNL